MMGLKPGPILIGLIALMASCGIWRVPNSTKEDFTYCYTGERTGLDTLIKTDGHYLFTLSYTKQEGNPPVEVEKSTQFKVGFYDDGTFLYRYECGEGFWGRYIVVADTIKAQFVHPPGSMRWIKGEVWFVIINNSEIKDLVLKYVEEISFEDASNYWAKHEEISQSNGIFVAENDLPDANHSWLKHENWYWCDEGLYNNWFQELRNKSK